MTKQEIKIMLSAIDKHIAPYTNGAMVNNKKMKNEILRTELHEIANCVLGLSAVVRKLIKGEKE